MKVHIEILNNNWFIGTIKFNRKISINSIYLFGTFNVENDSIRGANLLVLHDHILFCCFLFFFQKERHIQKGFYD